MSSIHPVPVNQKLENVHWIIIPVHIGDPISVADGGSTWRVKFEKITSLLISVLPLARIAYAVQYTTLKYLLT